MPLNFGQVWEGMRAPFGGRDAQSIDFIIYNPNGDVYRQIIHYSDIVTHMAKGEFRAFGEEIEDIRVYRKGKGNNRIFHAFVVFRTATFCYSIERWDKYISIQCSTSLDIVIGRDHGYQRGEFRHETDWALGQGTVWDMIRLMMQKKVFKKKFNQITRNCQVFAEFVFENFNAEGKKFYKYRKQQPRPNILRKLDEICLYETLGFLHLAKLKLRN